jgi:hypothetical protein
MKSKVLVLTLLLIMIISAVPNNAADNTQTNAGLRMKPLIEKLNTFTASDITTTLAKYSDVKNHWANPYIGKLTLLKILEGSNGKFVPDGNINIASFIKITVLALGYKISPSISIKTNWYDSYVKQALKDKLIVAGEFKDYTKAITREQAAKIIFRAATLKEAAPENKDYFTVMRCRITDFAHISDKYKDSFVKAYLMGYFELPANGGSFPKNNLTRAQACVLLYKLLDDDAKAKFAVREDEYYMAGDVKVYPAVAMEPVKAINHMIKSMGVSKGHVKGGGYDDTKATFTFYASYEERLLHSVTGMDATLEIRNGTKPYFINWPYYLDINNRIEFMKYHKDFVKELFVFLFEKDGQKAFSEYEKFMVIKSSEEKYRKVIRVGDRYLDMNMFNGNGVTVFVTCKGGSSRIDQEK